MEVFVVLILFVAFPWVLFKGVTMLRLSKSPAPSGLGLKASDLRAIVEEAVATATEPLHDRIDTLEGLLMGEAPAAAGARRGRIAETLLDSEIGDLDDAPAPRRRRPVAG